MPLCATALSKSSSAFITLLTSAKGGFCAKAKLAMQQNTITANNILFMIVFGSPVQDDAGLQLFQCNNVEVSRELLAAERSTRRTPVNAEERIFRGRKTVEAMDVG